jgi:hypothetical protein
VLKSPPIANLKTLPVRLKDDTNITTKQNFKKMTNNGKAKIEKTFGGLNIIIPSKKNCLHFYLGLLGWVDGFLGL